MQSRTVERSGSVGRVGDYGLLIVLSIIWGLAFVAIRVLDGELGFVNLTLLRWFVAAVGYLVLLAFVGRAKVRFERGDLPRLLVIGFLNVAAYHLALNYGEVTVSAGLAGLLIALGPVFSVLLSAAFLNQRAGARLVLAVVSAMAGAAVLLVGDLPSGLTLWGPSAVILAVLSYAMFGLLSRPLVEKYGALHLAIWAGLVGTVMILPLTSGSLLTDAENLPTSGWAALLYLSLLSTVVGYSLFYTLVGRVGVSRLMIQLYLAPVVSVVGGAIILGETVTAYTIVGGGLMLTAVWLATKRIGPRPANGSG